MLAASAMTTSVKASAVRSTRTSSSRGRSAGASATRTPTPAVASKIPPQRGEQPEHDALRQQLPHQPPAVRPTAARTTISRSRDVERASSRLATFAHAISSTNANRPEQNVQRGARIADDELLERHDRRSISPRCCSGIRRSRSARSPIISAARLRRAICRPSSGRPRGSCAPIGMSSPDSPVGVIDIRTSREAKAGWQDADDGVDAFAEFHRRAERRRSPRTAAARTHR